MEQIIVNSSISIHSVAILGICIFLFVAVYILAATSIAGNEISRMKRARKMINEGHEKALNGRKDDGYFEEVRKLRDTEDDEDYYDDGYDEDDDYEED